MNRQGRQGNAGNFFNHETDEMTRKEYGGSRRCGSDQGVVGGVSDADFVHHHKPLWLHDVASGSETPPTAFLRHSASPNSYFVAFVCFVVNLPRISFGVLGGLKKKFT
jgi:hypothetical protein